jgi:hypothetical protein
LEHLPKLLNSSHLFARKIQRGTSDILLKAFEKIR